MKYSLLFLSLFTAALTVKAVEIDPYLDDGTFLVARVSVAELLNAAPKDLSLIVDWCDEQGIPLDGEIKKNMPQANGVLKIAQSLGISDAYLFVAIDDIRFDYGPMLLLTMLEERDPAPTALLLRNAIPSHLPLGIPSTSKTKPSVELTNDKQGILLGSEKSVARYLSIASIDRPDLIEPLTQASSDRAEGGINIAFSLGNDARRVIRELWPSLSGPFKNLTGTLLADQMQHLEATARLQPTPQASAKFAMSDSRSAKQLSTMVKKGLMLAVDQILKEELIDERTAELAEKSISITQDNNHVLLNLNTNTQEGLIQLITQPLLAAHASARRNSQINNMKQVALAMHNFHDVNDYFPAPAAICDPEGNPLLSWRVAILPFLEENKLFNQFHLDEPWNSPHNLNLAKQIPLLYQDLNHPQLADLGMTTLQRPVYDGSQSREEGSELSSSPIEVIRDGKPKFYQTPGLQIRDYIDGISNTILAVQVASEHAVVWTKPADWEVDLDKPKAKLFGDGQDLAITGWSDGHARVIKKSIGEEVLRKIITHNGKEPINTSDIR